MSTCETQLYGIIASDIEPTTTQKDGARRSQNALRDALYTGNLEADLRGAALDRARGAKSDLHFLWIGATKPGEPHYWRVQGKGFAIELDDVQGGANHVHTLWRDLEDDFGEDLLRRHREEHHGKK